MFELCKTMKFFMGFNKIEIEWGERMDKNTWWIYLWSYHFFFFRKWKKEESDITFFCILSSLLWLICLFKATFVGLAGFVFFMSSLFLNRHTSGFAFGVFFCFSNLWAFPPNKCRSNPVRFITKRLTDPYKSLSVRVSISGRRAPGFLFRQYIGSQ